MGSGHQDGVEGIGEILDRSAIGETSRYIAGARLKGETWRASLYGQYYDWNMVSDPTYDFQINQLDRRSVFGGRFERWPRRVPRQWARRSWSSA